jgi:hypothetical protein
MQETIELFYGKNWQGRLLFIEANEAKAFVNLFEAVRHGLSQKLTWGEFREQFPDEFEVFSDQLCFNEEDFENWLMDFEDELKGVDILSAREQYKDYYIEGNGMPLPEWPFELKDFDYDQMENWFRFNPQRGCINDLPRELIEKFGKIEVSSFDGDFLTFNPEYENELIKELERSGFKCTKDQDVIEKILDYPYWRDLPVLKQTSQIKS